MRQGQNPAKSVTEVAHPAEVTVALITYIPFLSGYYREALDVLKVCLESIRANTARPFDLLVFDNASCPEVVEFLHNQQQAGRIQVLILSDRNLGKVGAWNVIFGAAQGEYIAYSDFDVYYYPGWLEKHLEVFAAFPEAGTVCGLPRRGRRDFYTNTLAVAGSLPGVTFEEGKFIPEEWIRDHARSVGKEDSVAEDLENTDFRLQRGGTVAYATATHFQFMVRKAVISRFLPFDYDRPMGASVAEFDRAMNQGNLVRLAVSERVVRHLGNTIDVEVVNALPGLTQSRAETGPDRRAAAGILNWTPVRWLLLRLYDWIFLKYYTNRPRS